MEFHLDTEGTFRPERIAQIAERFDIDPELANENIIVVRALNSDHQNDVLADLNEHFVSGEYRLLVIDSICALFRVDYIGRGELQDRQSKLGVYLNRVKNMAEEFNLTVLMTNQVQSDPGASALFASADGRKPIGGHVVAHASTTRVLLRKGRGEERVAKIQDSPGMATSSLAAVVRLILTWDRVRGTRGHICHHYGRHRGSGQGVSLACSRRAFEKTWTSTVDEGCVQSLLHWNPKAVLLTTFVQN